VVELRNVAASRDHWMLGFIPLPWPFARAVAGSVLVLYLAAALGALHDEG
jgi:hypothetical protein